MHDTHVAVARFIDPLILGALSIVPLFIVFPAQFKGVVYLVLLIGAIRLWRIRPEARAALRAIRPLAILFALYLPYALANILFWKSPGKNADNGLHFLYFLTISVCFLLPRADSPLKHAGELFWSGISAAALGAGALAIYQRFVLDIRPYGMYGINELAMSGSIKFGMVTALFSLLALLAALNSRTPLRLRIWHGTASLVGFAGCQAITSRGPLVTLLLLGAGIALVKILQLERKWRWLTAAFALAGTALVLILFHEPLWERVAETSQEFVDIANGNLNTSIGARMIMWSAALEMFLQHPLFGVGLGRFGDALQAMIQAGAAPEFIGVYGHAHNEYLEWLAIGGILGLTYLLLLFCCPLAYFMRRLARLRAEGADTGAAAGGLVTMLCFALFAIGDNIFDRQMTNSLFAFLTLGFAVMAADLRTRGLSQAGDEFSYNSASRNGE